MNDLKIKYTRQSPQVSFLSMGWLQIHGRSILLNPHVFYTQIEEWITEYSRRPAYITRMDFLFEMLHADSLPCILRLLKLLQDLKESGRIVEVYWYHEQNDEDMRDIIHQVAEIFSKLQIDIQEVGEIEPLHKRDFNYTPYRYPGIRANNKK